MSDKTDDDPDAPLVPETATEADLQDAIGTRKPRASSRRRPEELDAGGSKPSKVPVRPSSGSVGSASSVGSGSAGSGGGSSTSGAVSSGSVGSSGGPSSGGVASGPSSSGAGSAGSSGAPSPGGSSGAASSGPSSSGASTSGTSTGSAGSAGGAGGVGSVGSVGSGVGSASSAGSAGSVGSAGGAGSVGSAGFSSSASGSSGSGSGSSGYGAGSSRVGSSGGTSTSATGSTSGSIDARSRGTFAAVTSPSDGVPGGDDAVASDDAAVSDDAASALDRITASSSTSSPSSSSSSSSFPSSSTSSSSSSSPTPYAVTKSPPTRTPVRYAPDDDGDDDDDDSPAATRSKRKLYAVGAITLFVGVGIAALIFLGRANSERLQISCQADKIIAEQGRSFPPWGFRPLSGAEWKSIDLPPEAECQTRGTESMPELHAWYLDALFARAKALLDAREVTSVDVAEAQLKQALLHAREPSLQTQRALIANWLGNVGYWRASAKLKDAAAALAEVAKLFDAASAAEPVKLKDDAKAWALYIQKIVGELNAGPHGTTPLSSDMVHVPEKPPAHEPPPMGSALPVEPAGSGSGSSAPPPVAPPDAGVSAGGVLL